MRGIERHVGNEWLQGAIGDAVPIINGWARELTCGHFVLGTYGRVTRSWNYRCAMCCAQMTPTAFPTHGQSTWSLLNRQSRPARNELTFILASRLDPDHSIRLRARGVVSGQPTTADR